MKPPDHGPTHPIDRDVADAFAALDRTVQEGALDDFAARVMARLGDEAPGRASAAGPTAPNANDAAAPGPGSPTPAASDSGLHDIRALASSARRRFGERDGSEADGDDSAVLLTTVQGGLRGVALPDASRAAPRIGQSGRSETEVRRDARSNAPFWILGSVATLAATAAVAVFVFGIGRADRRVDGELMARAEIDEAPAPASQAAPAGTLPEPARGYASPPAPAAPPATTTAPVEPSEAKKLVRKEAVASSDPAAATKSEPGRRGRTRGAPRTVEDEATAAKPEQRDRSVEGGVEGGVAGGVLGGVQGDTVGGTGAPAAGEDGAGKGGGTVSLDDMLDQATGKKPAPAPETEAERRKKAEASRTGLERRDVTDGLAAIAGAVQRCGSVENVRGSVAVKFVVGPDGKVKSAAATGAHARSKTGACVASAVTGARFPAFQGDPVTINFPFSLSGPP